MHAQTGGDSCACLYCLSRLLLLPGCPGHHLLPGLGQKEGLLCPYLSPDPLPDPHKCMWQVSMRTYSRFSKQINFSHLLQSPVRADYGYGLSVPLLLIKSSNFVLPNFVLVGCHGEKSHPPLRAAVITADEGQLPSRIDQLALSCG